MAITITVSDNENHTISSSKKILSRQGELGETITFSLPSTLNTAYPRAWIMIQQPDGQLYYIDNGSGAGFTWPNPYTFTYDIGDRDTMLSSDGTLGIQIVLRDATPPAQTVEWRSRILYLTIEGSILSNVDSGGSLIDSLSSGTLNRLADIQYDSLADGDLLYRDTATGKWRNVTLVDGLNITHTLNKLTGELTFNSSGTIPLKADNILLDDTAGRISSTQVEGAIAEIAGTGRTTESLANIGLLSSLTTTEKGTVVGSINEVNAQLADIAYNVESFPMQVPEVNDTGRINRAIADPNVKVLQFNPYKTYTISGKIKGKSNLFVFGRMANIKWADNSNPTSGGADANIGMFDFTEEIYENVLIDGFFFNGNRTNNTWVPKHTYTVTSTNGVDGIRAGTVNNFVVTNCVFSDIQKMAIDINGTGKDIWIYKNLVIGSQRDGIFVTASNVHIFQNNVSGTGDNGIAFYSAFHADPTTVGNVHICDNIVTITNPISNQCGIFVGAKAGALSKNAKIYGNTIVGTTYHGIEVLYMAEVSIDDNTVKNLDNSTVIIPHGILVRECSSVTIGDKNRVRNCRGSGLVLIKNTNVSVNGEYHENKRDGIQIDGGNVGLKFGNIKAYNNGRGLLNVDEKWSGIRFWDSSLLGASSDIEIGNVSCFDTTSTVANKIQRFGITIEASSVILPLRIDNCRLSGNRNGNIQGSFPSGFEDYRNPMEQFGTTGYLALTTSYGALTTITFPNPYPVGTIPTILLSLNLMASAGQVTIIPSSISNTGFTISGFGSIANTIKVTWDSKVL